MNSRFLPLPWRCLSCAGTGAERAQSWHLALLGAASLPSLSSALRQSKVIKSSSAAPFSIPALPTAPPDPPSWAWLAFILLLTPLELNQTHL